MNQQAFDTRWVINRNKALASAGEGIIEARKLLDPEIGENPNFYPPQSLLDKTEVFITLPDEINQLQDSLWLQMKQ